MEFSHTSPTDSSGLSLSCSKKLMLGYLAFRYCAGNRRRSGWEDEAVKYLANGLRRMNRAENPHAASASGHSKKTIIGDVRADVRSDRSGGPESDDSAPDHTSARDFLVTRTTHPLCPPAPSGGCSRGERTHLRWHFDHLWRRAGPVLYTPFDSALLLLSLDASIFALVFLFAVGLVVVCEPFCPLLGKIATCV